MLKLITDEGTFEYIDLIELIHEYDKSRLVDRNVPNDGAMVFKLEGDDVTYLINEEFNWLIYDLKGQYACIMRSIPKMLFIEFGYYRVRE